MKVIKNNSQKIAVIDWATIVCKLAYLCFSTSLNAVYNGQPERHSASNEMQSYLVMESPSHLGNYF